MLSFFTPPYRLHLHYSARYAIILAKSSKKVAKFCNKTKKAKQLCKGNKEILEMSQKIFSHISLHLNKLMDRKSVSITCRFPLFVSFLFLIKTVNNKKSRARYDIILYHTWPCPIIDPIQSFKH